MNILTASLSRRVLTESLRVLTTASCHMFQSQKKNVSTPTLPPLATPMGDIIHRKVTLKTVS